MKMIDLKREVCDYKYHKHTYWDNGAYGFQLCPSDPNYKQFKGRKKMDDGTPCFTIPKKCPSCTAVELFVKKLKVK